MKPPRAWLVRAAACTAALLTVIALVYAYTRPTFLIMLSNQVWACF